MTSVSSRRLVGCTVYLSLVGLFSIVAATWVFANVTDGRPMLWITWLSVLGAFVALPTSMAVTRPRHDLPVPR